ncbi:NfuA Fe-S protein maturation [hydrothermal vent metagenome]|uniref:NfuA Fe-S protein maturation n=1 Tax=hydrothermal vent metagenome TaxID=652676 RepID=A0A1W1C344_9ZZZZ
MIKIEKTAEQYIKKLFEDQSDDNLALRIGVEKAGTPMATVSFNFCIPKELDDSYQKFSFEGFDAFIDEVHFEALKDAEVSLKEENSQQKLTIHAPNAKGKPPAPDAPLKERISYTIEAEINPQLASHNGFVEIVEITDDLIVVLNFGGGCQGCSSVKATLKHGVEGQLKAKYPEIKEVRDVTDHTQTENAYFK